MPEPTPRKKSLLDEISDYMDAQATFQAPSSQQKASAQPESPLSRPPMVLEETPEKQEKIVPAKKQLELLEKRLRQLLALEKSGKGEKQEAALRQKIAFLKTDLDSLERSSSETRLSLQILEEEKAKLEALRNELKPFVASLRELLSRKSSETHAIEQEVKALKSREEKARRQLESSNEKLFNLEGTKATLERKLREIESHLSEERVRVKYLESREKELKSLIDSGWAEARALDEQKTRLADSIAKLDKEKRKSLKAKARAQDSLSQLPSPGQAAQPAEAPSGPQAQPPVQAPQEAPAPESLPEPSHASQPQPTTGITDLETLKFLASVKYSESFSEQEASELLSQGFVRVKTESGLARVLLKLVEGEHNLQFFIIPRSSDVEKDFACWLCAVVLSDEASDVVSSGGVFDISFQSPFALENQARYAVEVSVSQPSSEEILDRLKKLSWAEDFVIFAEDHCIDAWKKNVSDPSHVVSAKELESERLSSVLSRLAKFSKSPEHEKAEEKSVA